MTDPKEYTPIDDVSVADDNNNMKKRGGVSFQILAGVTVAFAVSSGGYYHLLHASNNNSPQASVVSMTVSDVHPPNVGCPMGQEWCGENRKCLPPNVGCPRNVGCPMGQEWCEYNRNCLPPNVGCPR